MCVCETYQIKAGRRPNNKKLKEVKFVSSKLPLNFFKIQQKFRTTIFGTVQDIIFLRYAHYEHHHKLREGSENTFLRAQITIGDMFMLTCQVKFTLNFKS